MASSVHETSAETVTLAATENLSHLDDEGPEALPLLAITQSCFQLLLLSRLDFFSYLKDELILHSHILLQEIENVLGSLM